MTWCAVGFKGPVTATPSAESAAVMRNRQRERPSLRGKPRRCAISAAARGLRCPLRMETNLRFSEKWDSKVLKWSGFAVALFVVATLARWPGNPSGAGAAGAEASGRIAVAAVAADRR